MKQFNDPSFQYNHPNISEILEIIIGFIAFIIFMIVVNFSCCRDNNQSNIGMEDHYNYGYDDSPVFYGY